ncbi:hypothetical protein GCM10010221_26850 [Streptomyces parvus]|nr:hypothetical protein GCM10010221_26850 [Streptomyces parvus]
MAQKPNVACAGGCGRLLWSGRGSLPAGRRMCRACRRERAAKGVERICPGCGQLYAAVAYQGTGKLRVVCSDACRRVRLGRGGAEVPGT